MKKKAAKKSTSTPKANGAKAEGFDATPSKGGQAKKVVKVTGCQRKNGSYGYLVTW